MDRAMKVTFAAACAAAATVAVSVAGCASASPATTSTAIKALTSSGQATATSIIGATPTAPAPSSAVTVPSVLASAATSAPASASASSSTPSSTALAARAPGDRQKPVELMDSIKPSDLPIHRTADLGAASKVFQAVAARYRSQLADLSATGYGDAESTASTYIVVLGQFKATAGPSQVPGGTLAALGATKARDFAPTGARSIAGGLSLTCGVLLNQHSLCVWAGGGPGSRYMGAFEGPVGMSLADTAQASESVFGYVAP